MNQDTKQKIDEIIKLCESMEEISAKDVIGIDLDDLIAMLVKRDGLITKIYGVACEARKTRLQ